MEHAAAAPAPRGPAGTRRGTKRDLIVNLFLRREGPSSADDVFDLARAEDPGISRATVYRTLQWMVEAGIAKKADLGQGRFRFEHTYRHPRHFHLICKSCNRSLEFISSDVEALIDEIAAARRFDARQSVLQIYGTCEACRTGRASLDEVPPAELIYARDALRIAIATERSGLEFYSRAAGLAGDSRSAALFQRLARDKRERLGALEAGYKKLLTQDSQLEARPPFIFFKRAARGLFAEAADRLDGGAAGLRTLMAAVRCERGSHRFFKRYGERLTNPESRRMFLDVAREERSHLALLVREYRALASKQGRRTGARARGSQPGS
jgi:Fur family transcriptional regulator, ferric uptake regulator